MGLGVAVRRLVLVGSLLGAAFSASAAECPQPATLPGPQRAMTLRQILALPNQPDAALEGSAVATIGYLVRVSHVPAARTAPCGDGPAWRLWLSTREPYGLKGLASRHRAVVAVIPATVVRERLGGPRGLERLVGRRVWVAGRMAFNPGSRDRLMHTRGTLWELRALSDVVRCPAKTCTLAQPPR